MTIVHVSKVWYKVKAQYNFVSLSLFPPFFFSFNVFIFFLIILISKSWMLSWRDVNFESISPRMISFDPHNTDKRKAEKVVLCFTKVAC